MNHDKVFLGERFNIVFKVKNINGEQFDIDNAQYDVEVDGQNVYRGINAAIATMNPSPIK